MDAVDVMKDTVDSTLTLGTTCKRVHYDEKSDALYATNGHLLFVLPKRDLAEQPISEEDRNRFGSVIPKVDKQPTVRLALHYLKWVMEFFDEVGFVEGEAPTIDIYITSSDKVVTFTSPQAPGRVAVLMPQRLRD